MTNLRLLLSILLFLTVIMTSYGQDTWVEYKDKTSISFQVNVPAEMQKKVQNVTAEVGDLVSVTYGVQGPKEDGGKAFMVNTLTYPEGVIDLTDKVGIDSLINASIESIAASINGTVVYIHEHENKLESLFRISYKENTGTVKGKAIVSDDTFILLQVYAAKNDSLDDDIDYFLKSFRLVK